MIVLITPTGGRKKQFKLCQQWMRNQTYKGDVTWIIVDDVIPKTSISKKISNWNIIEINPKPAWKGGMNTQSRNLKAGIDILKDIKDIEAVFIIEDDDYYSPNYLVEMLKRLKGFDAAGEINTVYYHIPAKRYLECHNRRHSSLFQTVFTMQGVSVFKNSLNTKFIDVEFWRNIKSKNLFYEGNLSVGIKGLQGRPGIGIGHKEHRLREADINGEMLKELIGEDIKYYE